MSKLLQQYLELPHKRVAKAVVAEDILSELSKLKLNDLKPNEIVAIQDDDPFRWVCLFLHVLDHGGVPLALPPKKDLPNTSLILNGCWQHRESTQLSSYKEPHYICLTSGSTGEPKMIPMAVSRAKLNAELHAEAFSLNSEQRIIQCLPVFHSYGIIAYIFTALRIKIPIDFQPLLISLRTLKDHPDTNLVIHMSPSQARFILKDKFTDASRIKTFTIGAGALTVRDLQDLSLKFPTTEIYVSYGLTELGPRVSAGKITTNEAIDFYVGKPLKGVDVKVLGEDNKILSHGEGVLLVRSPCVNLKATSDESMSDYYITRDRVHLTTDQKIYFLSREQDLIKCGGISLYPAEMERYARELLNVECVVLKKSHPIHEEVPVLVVEQKASMQNEIIEHLRKYYSEALLPREVYFLETFPRNSLHKIDRQKLWSEIEQ
jgi:acyl-coenzyme A synthetase/AMP-(fatty) acid ligase